MTAVAGPRPAVTLRDVAAAADVHPATASRALQPGTRRLVRAETADRVLRAARELGYQRNVAAASLRTHRTYTAGLIVDDIAGPLAAALARGVDDELAAAGYLTLTASHGGDADRQAGILTQMASRHVDGLILGAGAATLPPPPGWPVPVVAAGDVPGGWAMPSVSADLACAMRAVIAHLAELGHRRIAFIGAAGQRARQQDFQAAMAAAGMDAAGCPQLTARSAAAEEGRRCCRELLRCGAGCTAIVAAGDILAAGCCQELTAAGGLCPAGMSVTGLGDLPLAGSLSPPLTTVRLPQRRVGGQAAALLLRSIAGRPPASGRLLILPELVVRNSTAQRP